jgi:hypothetical protein
MDQSTFWRLVSKIDRGALREGDEEGAVEPLVEALSQLAEAEIGAFEDQLAQCLFDLDGRQYADQAGESGQSGDGFLYARCYVVARGKKYFEGVKASPERMPKSTEDWCESLLYAARQAWAMSTGNDEDDWDHLSPVSYETGSNRAQWG